VVDDPVTERTPLGMRLIWLLLPGLLFGLYFWMLLRGGGDGEQGEKPAPPAVETEAPTDTR